jgi:dihydroneopterin aldolase
MQNPAQLTIKLQQVRFFGFHGLYENETKTGNEFVIDLAVTIFPQTSIIRSMDDSISYVTLFELVQQRMLQREDLLETLAMDLVHQIHGQFKFVKKVSINIDKCTPPFINFSGKVGVSYTKEF